MLLILTGLIFRLSTIFRHIIVIVFPFQKLFLILIAFSQNLLAVQLMLLLI